MKKLSRVEPTCCCDRDRETMGDQAGGLGGALRESWNLLGSGSLFFRRMISKYILY